jgi:hypothetical protein
MEDHSSEHLKECNSTNDVRGFLPPNPEGGGGMFLREVYICLDLEMETVCFSETFAST